MDVHTMRHNLHLKNYAYRLYLVVFCLGSVLVNFTHIFQGCFTGNCPCASEATLKDMGKTHAWQSSKLAGSPKFEVGEIMLRTSETILVLVRSD